MKSFLIIPLFFALLFICCNEKNPQNTTTTPPEVQVENEIHVQNEFFGVTIGQTPISQALTRLSDHGLPMKGGGTSDEGMSGYFHIFNVPQYGVVWDAILMCSFRDTVCSIRFIKSYEDQEELRKNLDNLRGLFKRQYEGVETIYNMSKDELPFVYMDETVLTLDVEQDSQQRPMLSLKFEDLILVDRYHQGY